MEYNLQNYLTAIRGATPKIVEIKNDLFDRKMDIKREFALTKLRCETEINQIELKEKVLDMIHGSIIKGGKECKLPYTYENEPELNLWIEEELRLHIVKRFDPDPGSNFPENAIKYFIIW
jgi:hypothetical protein